jgi:hypothetical protein
VMERIGILGLKTKKIEPNKSKHIKVKIKT